jgi:glutamate-ammonia-ligase adenylyltransferase
LLSRILVTSRLVAPGGEVPQVESRALVAEVCGHADWASLLEAHDAARQRIGLLWAKVRDGTT